MSRKMICLISFVLVLSIAGNASADLVGYWKLDVGSGNTVFDSSPSGNDGTFAGDPQWVAGVYSAALAFDGTGDNIDFGNDPSASSSLNFRVKSLEFSPCVVDFELPVHTALLGVGFLRPGSNLGLENFEFPEATVPQALTGHATQFALGDV